MRSLRANFRSFASDDKMDGFSECSEMFEYLSCNDMTLKLVYAIKYTTKTEILNLIHICIKLGRTNVEVELRERLGVRII